MNLALTDEQREIVDATRTFVEREASARADAPGVGLWEQTAGLGWLALGLPETVGGAGLGCVEEALLFVELGRGLVGGPYLGTTLAAHVAVASGDLTLASRLAAGKVRAGCRMGDLVVDAEPGDLAIDLAGPMAAVRSVDGVEQQRGVDPGVRVGRATWGDLVVESDHGPVVTRARILVAAALTGIIEVVRAMARDYALERVQFGRPIGSFQAVKHRCAGMEVAAQAARAQTLFAAHTFDAAHADAVFQAAAAFLVAVRGMRRSTADNIQVHGAMGFTAEHGAHRYVRRGLVLERVLGPIARSVDDVLAPERHDFA